MIEFASNSKASGTWKVVRISSTIVFWGLYQIIPLYVLVFGFGFSDPPESRIITTLFPYVVLPAPFLFFWLYSTFSKDITPRKAAYGALALTICNPTLLLFMVAAIDQAGQYFGIIKLN